MHQIYPPGPHYTEQNIGGSNMFPDTALSVDSYCYRRFGILVSICKIYSWLFKDSVVWVSAFASLFRITILILWFLSRPLTGTLLLNTRQKVTLSIGKAKFLNNWKLRGLRCGGLESWQHSPLPTLLLTHFVDCSTSSSLFITAWENLQLSHSADAKLDLFCSPLEDRPYIQTQRATYETASGVCSMV